MNDKEHDALMTWDDLYNRLFDIVGALKVTTDRLEAAPTDLDIEGYVQKRRHLIRVNKRDIEETNKLLSNLYSLTGVSTYTDD